MVAQTWSWDPATDPRLQRMMPLKYQPFLAAHLATFIRGSWSLIDWRNLQSEGWIVGSADLILDYLDCLKPPPVYPLAVLGVSVADMAAGPGRVTRNICKEAVAFSPEIDSSSFEICLVWFVGYEVMS